MAAARGGREVTAMDAYKSDAHDGDVTSDAAMSEATSHKR